MTLSYEGGEKRGGLLQSYAPDTMLWRRRPRTLLPDACWDCFNYRCRLRSQSWFTRETLRVPRKHEKRENSPLPTVAANNRREEKNNNDNSYCTPVDPNLTFSRDVVSACRAPLCKLSIYTI